MNWRKHETKEQKEIRKKMYKMLREAGCSSHVAMVCRDWTTSKVNKICAGAQPSLTW